MNHRVTLWALAAVIVTCANFGYAEIPVQTLPETGDMYEMLDLQDPYRTTISGLFVQEIDFNSTSQQIHVYIGSENRQSEPFVLLLVDPEEDVPSFVERSGWQTIADEQGLIIAIAQPLGTTWEAAEDLEYLDAVYTQTHNRSHYNAQKGNNYLVAYGDAATIGQMWTMKSPQNFASFATFGDLQPISENFMRHAASEPSKLDGVAIGDLPMPTWLFTSELDANAQAVVDYWNARNNASEEKFSTDLAAGVFMARTNTTDSLINEQNFLAQTRYSVVADPETAEPATTRAVWGFLSSVVRPVGFSNNALRPARSVEEWGGTTRHLEVDGVNRYWVEYVPEQTFPTDGTEVPLVVYFHGNNNTAQSMVARSELIKVAKERGFITILLTGALYNTHRLFPNPKWNLTESEDEFDDYAYVRAAIADTVERLPIDTSRVYAMGQSYGSMAMLAMSLRMNDVFAAGAGTGGFLLGDRAELYESEKVLRDNQMPIQVLLGEFDGAGGVWENQQMREQMPYWLERNGLIGDVDEALTGTYKSGRFNVFEFSNDRGVPLVQYVTVDQRIHTIVPMDLYFQYDTFVSKWSRGEDGTLYYMGKAVD